MNGHRAGVGVYNYINGDLYEGEWEDNLQNGFCVYTFNGGSTCEGKFNKGQIKQIKREDLYQKSFKKEVN